MELHRDIAGIKLIMTYKKEIELSKFSTCEF